MRLAVSACVVAAARACWLQSQDSGVCTDMVAFAADPAGLKAQMPFCGPVLGYPSACLPKAYSYFPNSTVLAKDTWAQQFYTQAVARRMQIEDTNHPSTVSPPLRAWGGWGLQQRNAGGRR